MSKLNNALTRCKKAIMAMCTLVIALATVSTPVLAANTTDISNIIDSVISFLAWGVGGIGGFLALFGIVTLGIGFSGDNASEKQKGIIGFVGGIIVIGAAILIGTVGASLISAPTF